MDKAISTVMSTELRQIDSLLRERKYPAALSAATRATQDEPDSAEAFYLLGVANFYLEKDAPAFAAFDRAIALRPEFAKPHFFRGLAFLYANQPARGRADLETACRLDASEPKYWYELGRFKARAGEHQGAIADLQRALRLDPKSAAVAFDLGTLYGELKQEARAVEMWERALALDPNHANAHFNLGIHHQLAGDPKLALSHYLAFQRLLPDEVDGLKKVIQAYYRLERFSEAEAHRERLLKLVRGSRDAAIRGLKEFCFDQFDVAEGRFFAYETIDKQPELVYLYTFKLLKGERLLKTIQLESSRGIREMGTPFMLGQTVGHTHTSFGVGFQSVPPYPELKQWVLRAHGGELGPGASSGPR